MTAVRLAILPDYSEERWPSMDLCAEMLAAHAAAAGLEATTLRPPFRLRWQRLPFHGRLAFNADRLLNRHWDYPRFLEQAARHFDAYHVVDHTYAHLVHSLPPERAGVYCHDLDAFGSLLTPATERRPWWFRKLAARTLRGLQRAALVFHNTAAVGAALRCHGLVEGGRLVHAPLGAAPEFTPGADLPAGPPFLVHVGACVPRKRVDVLLTAFAAARRRLPELRLVQVGGIWTPSQAAQIQELDIAGAVEQRRDLPRSQLADLYRSAALVLQPSAAEGFGLPVLEALACAAPVLASDIPALREVGGPAAVYCPVGDTAAWGEAVERLLTHPGELPPRDARLAQAARFSWAEHARIIAVAYRRLVGSGE